MIPLNFTSFFLILNLVKILVLGVEDEFKSLFLHLLEVFIYLFIFFHAHFGNLGHTFLLKEKFQESPKKIQKRRRKRKEMLIINSKINPCYVMVNLNLTEVFSTKTSSHKIRNTKLKCSLATVEI